MLFWTLVLLLKQRLIFPASKAPLTPDWCALCAAEEHFARCLENTFTSRWSKKKKTRVVVLPTAGKGALGKWQSGPTLGLRRLPSPISPELLNLLPRYSKSQSAHKRCSVCFLRPLCKQQRRTDSWSDGWGRKKGLNLNGKLAESVVKINYLSSSPLSISPDMMTQEEGKNIHVNSGSRLLWSDKPFFFFFHLFWCLITKWLASVPVCSLPFTPPWLDWRLMWYAVGSV